MKKRFSECTEEDFYRATDAALRVAGLGFFIWGCIAWDAVPAVIGVYLHVLAMGARRG